ncbi:hypothetical protein K1719_018473 [Acacia pycnantha]|nr:hypothetical protein K1719_018473 [Acacia pycnantha]
MEKLKDDLCCAAMKDQWSKVHKMLQEDMRLCTAKITVTRDTVFHMAMYAPEWSKKEVANMVDLCEARYIVDEESGGRTHVLGAVNADGNTPLHLAASIGNVEMCRKIGGVDKYSLIGKRNNDGETPIFLAALYGQRNAFLWLHYYYMKRPGASPIERTHCIRDNNDSILHCAIEQEHFDVAIEILHLYEDLVDATKKNKEGLTPLHLLAEKPSAFKSGTLLGRPFGHIAYLLLGDMKKEKATTEEELEKSERKSWVMHLKDAVVNKWISETKENKLVKTIIWVLDHFDLVGQSSRELVRVQEKKQKHAWSEQIMNKLLETPGTPTFLLPSTNNDGVKLSHHL